jgi:magnesium-transporting ATPase (P-type)
MLFPGLLALSMGHTVTFLLIMITLVISWMYHDSEEHKYQFLDSLTIRLVIVYFVIMYPIHLISLVSGLIAFYLYYIGTPRIPENERGIYTYYHPLAHIFTSLTAWFMLTNAS